MGKSLKCLVYFMKTPKQKWMMASGTPIYGNPHMCMLHFTCLFFFCVCVCLDHASIRALTPHFISFLGLQRSFWLHLTRNFDQPFLTPNATCKHDTSKQEWGMHTKKWMGGVR